MNIIIVGAGEVGKHLAQNLSNQLHKITLIDRREDIKASLDDHLNACCITENGTSASVLAENNVANCELFLALTSDDNTNLIAASIAKSMGAQTSVARVHASIEREEWLFNYREHFGIDHLFSNERLAAVELAKYIRNPHGMITEEIARGRIQLQQIIVSQNSPMLNQTISKLNLPKGLRLAAIYRKKDHLIAKGSDHLEPKDVVTLFGESARIAEIIPMLSPETSHGDAHNVVIFGGGEYARALTETLGGERVRILEKSKKECDRLSELLPNATVLCTDALSLQQLQEEQVGDADFFIAVSGDDEDNVIACLQVKSLAKADRQTPHCLTLIHRPDVANAVSRNRNQLGILAVVSPRLASNRDLLRFVKTEKMSKIAELQDEVEVIQIVIREGASVIGKKIAEINLPKGGALVGLIRDQVSIIPRGEHELMAGDAVYVILKPKTQRAFVKCFTQ